MTKTLVKSSWRSADERFNLILPTRTSRFGGPGEEPNDEEPDATESNDEDAAADEETDAEE